MKSGQKLTELGAIPADWDVSALSDLVINGPKNGYSGRSGKIANGTPTLSLAATSSGQMVLTDETIKRLDEVIEKKSALYLQPGDVLVQRSNTVDLVGTTAVFDGPQGTYVYPDLMMRLRFRDAVTARWFWRYANSEIGRRFFVGIAAGSTGSMPKISGQALKRMPVLLPPLPEQSAVVSVLDDVDALLSAQDRLVTKKRNLKLAAMQQLLTGQTRLPGFSGEWEVRRLSEVAETDPENLSGDTRPNFSFNYIALEDVDSGVLKNHSEQVFANSPSRARRRLRVDDVLVATVRPNLRSHLHFRQQSGTWVCSTGFCIVRSRKRVTHPGYIFNHLFGDSVNQQIDALLTGSNYPAINSGDVRALKIPLPSYNEQAAIAKVLSDMDAEITMLEQRREKTRAIKQGMMQELLTGKTRLC